MCVYRLFRQRFRTWRTRSRSCTEISPSITPSSTQIKWERYWTDRYTLTARYPPNTPLSKLWESCLKRCVKWYLDGLTFSVFLPWQKKKGFYICQFHFLHSDKLVFTYCYKFRLLGIQTERKEMSRYPMSRMTAVPVILHFMGINLPHSRYRSGMRLFRGSLMSRRSMKVTTKF